MTEDPTRWRPLSVRESGDYAAYDALLPGVPDHLDPSLWQWVRERIGSTDDLQAIERVFGITLSGMSRDIQTLLGSLRDLVVTREEFFLDVVDFLVARMRTDQFLPSGERTDRSEENMKALVELLVILTEARSLWTVGEVSPGRYRLHRRVPPAVQAAAEQVMSPRDRAAQHLRLAWNAVYGRQPNPGEGYGQAIKAMEAAAIPVVLPKTDVGTLGKVIAALRDKPAKWAVGLKHPEPERQVLILAEMLDLVWKGQTGRHGDPDPNAPISVTQEQAEAAVQLAVTLAQWFTTGVVTTR